MAPLPPVRKRATHPEVRADDLVMALFSDRILGELSDAMQPTTEGVADALYAVKHGKHNQASHGRRGRAGRAGQAAYRQARAGGASVGEARAAGRAATAAERQAEREERGAARAQRLQTQAQRARAAADSGQVTAAQRERLIRRAENLEARAEGRPIPNQRIPGAKPAPLNAPGTEPTALPVQRFGDDATADQALRQNVRLSQGEKTALDWYAGLGYEQINETLRTGGGMNPSVERTVSQMDAVMQRHRTTQNVELYRGMLTYSERGKARLARMQVGHVYSDPGYLSTSASMDYARSFGFGEKGEGGTIAVSVRVRVPAGTPGLYMPSARPNQGANEYEMLLARGLNYRVVGRRESDGKVELDVEVIP